jgi:hypothetical protein
MNALRQYWTKLDQKPLRFAGAGIFVVTLLFFLNNSPGSNWNHVGLIFDVVGLLGLFWLLRKRH